MRFINLIVVHCSATRCDRCYTEHDLTTDHLRRGFSGAGYHFISARTVTSSPCVPCPCLVPMSGVGMQVASVSATKAVLTSAVALPIHAPFPKALPACACVAAAEGLSRFPALRSPRPEPRLRGTERIVCKS